MLVKQKENKMKNRFNVEVKVGSVIFENYGVGCGTFEGVVTEINNGWYTAISKDGEEVTNTISSVEPNQTHKTIGSYLVNSPVGNGIA
jgi:hypothetical protein